MMATISVQMKKNPDLDEPLIRHIALNSIRWVRNTFKGKYGDLVICADAGYSWRRDVYSYYKQSRRDSRKSDGKDWHEIFTTLNRIRDEINETFHYPLIHVEKCEADDVIGVLCHEFGDTFEPILIYSGDKDFAQLQRFKNVHQYNPAQKKFIKIEDPILHLKEHIIRGDSSDGIPNFLSEDDTFVSGASQKRIYNDRVKKWLEQDPEQFCDETTHYQRNQRLIDLSMVPEYLWDRIMIEYESQLNKKDNDVLAYMQKHKLKNLMSNLQEFINETGHSGNTARSLF